MKKWQQGRALIKEGSHAVNYICPVREHIRLGVMGQMHRGLLDYRSVSLLARRPDQPNDFASKTCQMYREFTKETLLELDMRDDSTLSLKLGLADTRVRPCTLYDLSHWALPKEPFRTAFQEAKGNLVYKANKATRYP